jgi:hypothetical protein
VFYNPVNLDSNPFIMPEVVPPALVDLLHHLLLPLPLNIWHAISNTQVFQPILQVATGLTEFQYKTLLLSCGIYQRRGENIGISNRHLDYLKIQLQENVQLNYSYTKPQRGERNLYFICKGGSRHPNPRHNCTTII